MSTSPKVFMMKTDRAGKKDHPGNRYRKSPVKRLAFCHGLPEQRFKFCAVFSPDVDMIVRTHEAGLEFAVRGDPEPGAVGAELGIVDRAHDLDLGPVKAVFFPVMHPQGHDLF